MYAMVVDECLKSEALTGCVALCAPRFGCPGTVNQFQEGAMQLGRVENLSRA